MIYQETYTLANGNTIPKRYIYRSCSQQQYRKAFIFLSRI